MDFSFSEEQQMLKDSVDRYVREVYEFENRRKWTASEEGFSRDNWKQMAELGWLGVALPEQYGGIGGGPIETMVIMEAIGTGLVLEPFMATVVLGANAVNIAGSEAQKGQILPKVAGGEMMLALAYAERQSRFDLHDVELTASADGDGFILNGHKGVVLNAASADKIIVSARTSGASRDRDGITLFIIDAGAAGVELRNYPTVDGLRASEVTFGDVKAGSGAVLGEVGGGHGVLSRVAELAIAALAAEAVGCMQLLLDTTNEYLKTRVQFGQPIGKFQVLQHRMVDMFMNVEEARSMAYMSSMKVNDEDADERARAIAATKVQIGKSGRFVGQQSVQLHGGMGMTDELNVGHYFKRLTMIETMFGNQDYHLRRYGEI